MNIKYFTLIFLTFPMSFHAISASEIIRKEAVNYIKIGNVSVSGEPTSNQAILSIKEKSKLAGADYFLVTALTVPGDNSKWSANAVIYKNSFEFID